MPYPPIEIIENSFKCFASLVKDDGEANYDVLRIAYMFPGPLDELSSLVSGRHIVSASRNEALKTAAKTIGRYIPITIGKGDIKMSNEQAATEVPETTVKTAKPKRKVAAKKKAVPKKKVAAKKPAPEAKSNGVLPRSKDWDAFDAMSNKRMSWGDVSKRPKLLRISKQAEGKTLPLSKWLAHGTEALKDEEVAKDRLYYAIRNGMLS